MLGERIAIIGSGEYAARLGMALPARARKWILASTKADAALVADEVGAIATDQPHILRGVEIVFVLPEAGAENGLLLQALPHLHPDTVVLFLGDRAPTPAELAAWPDLLFIRGKLIGDLLVLGNGPSDVLDELAELLAGIGTVMRAPESNLERMEQVVDEVVQAVAETLRQRLNQIVDNPEFSEVVIASVAPMRLAALARTSSSVTRPG
jgi:hypothetical protein